MSIRLVRLRDLEPSDKSTLEERLTKFYQTTPALYYQIADQAAEQYVSALLPFHCDLVSRIAPGTKVVELGCGSAHLCRQVEKMGGVYLGMDHDEHLLQRNRERFSRARFLPLSAKLDEQFDVVASLYTIEHVVDPPAYLEAMWKFCKPGGLIGIICPDFVDGEGFPPSLYYGKTPRHFRAKFQSFALTDTYKHLLDLFWFAPRWKRRARFAPPGAFWINLEPRALCGTAYSIDTDAVHFPRLKDLVWWLEQRGAVIVRTSQAMPDVDPSVLRYNCYVLASKPAG
jgi:2-polyprenyl-3-methyl-5-hydroxy-6-metoxy-1,4-benzoquinol methylase